MQCLIYVGIIIVWVHDDMRTLGVNIKGITKWESYVRLFVDIAAKVATTNRSDPSRSLVLSVSSLLLYTRKSILVLSD